LPKAAIRDTDLEHLSVEEVYELLQKKSQKAKLPLADLLNPGSMATHADQSDDGGKPGREQSQSGSGPGGELHDLHDRSALEAHWKQASQQAKVLASSQGQGSLPSGMQRHLGEIADPQMDWRSLLWRYLVRTPTDFSGFDRRFLHCGLYLDHLEGESVQVFCCIDTSGSIDDEQMSLFLGELSGILSSYPMLDCQLWYADADCYGPYTLSRIAEVPRPEGGGGTDFRPFFKAAHEAWSGDQEAVCVYLTDGMGEFPEEPPELPVLWVIVPGGLSSDEIPFGEVCRLI
jgi:predicted metal-dependent peptidase